MGKALQVLTGQATNPGSTVTAVTMNSGDSNTVRSTNMNADIELIQAWAFTTTNLLLRVRSPRMHDQAQNMRFQPPASLPLPLMPWQASQLLYSQDPLTIELIGGGAEVDMGSLLVYYDDLPGVSARLHNWHEIDPIVQNITVVQATVTSSGTSCNYSATVALNANFDTLIRNVDYAIIGYECGTTGGTFGITGVDTGNLRVGGPLIARPDITNNWFAFLSQATGRPCVPVINSANVAGINLDVACQATSTAFVIGVVLAQLKTPLAGHTQ
jgi:hypothetical protein